MSLFIGKDSSGNAVLHTTNTVKNLSDMRDNISDNTMFHSSLPYVQQVYMENIPTYKISHWSGQDYYYTFSAQLSNTLIDYINQGYLFDVILSTANSGNVRVALDFSSRFTKQGPPMTSRDDYFTSTYSYGPNADYNTWIPGSNSPSYSNRFINLYNSNLYVDGSTVLLGISSYLGSADTINGDATVIIYNMDTNGVIKRPSTVSEIKINKDEFLITSNLGVIDLVNFKPIRLKTSPISFKRIFGNSQISPYTSSLLTPVAWEINSSDSSNVFINKTGSNNVTETVVGNNAKNLVHYATQEVSYSLATHLSTSEADLNIVIPADTYLGIVNNGVFSNGYISNRPTYGLSLLLENGAKSTLIRGYSYRSSNGVEYFADYYCRVKIVNNRVKIEVSSFRIPTGAGTMDTGYFSGTLKILFFKFI